MTQSLELMEQTRSGSLQDRMRDENVRLVRQVFFSGAEIPQVVAFSAVEPGNGCTWVCARAAVALSAHVAEGICLVDADLRSPSLHRHFDTGEAVATDKKGFRMLPVRKAGQPNAESNLRLLSIGAGKTGSPVPQDFERLRTHIPELRKDFAHILIDAPPINTSADAMLLGGMADGLVMVLEANRTRRGAAIRARETVSAAGIRLLGVVLNKRTFPIPEILYQKL